MCEKCHIDQRYPYYGFPVRRIALVASVGFDCLFPSIFHQ